MLLEAGIVLGGAFIYSLLTNDKKPEQIRLSDYDELSDLTGEGVILSKNIRLSQHFSNEHTLVVAPSGAGKSRRIIIPNVKVITDSTLIITDPSREIEEECRDIHKNTLIFNPFDPLSIGYDPLKNCKTASEVKKAAQIIITNGSVASEQSGSKASSNHGEWLTMCTPLLTAYMLWNWKVKKYDFSTLIKRLVSKPMFPNEEKRIFDTIGSDIMDSNVEEAQIEFMSFIQVAGAPTTLSCIRNVLNSTLQMFLDENIQRIMSKKSINLSQLRRKPYALYIQIPEKDCEFYSPISALLISQMLDKLIEDKNGIQVYCLFDELCNIGMLPGFAKLLSTCRKRNISITACIQSLIQLQRVYGDIQSKELTELFKSMVFMSGLKESAEYVSNMLGNTQIKKDKQTITVPVMTSDEIRRLDSKKCLLLCHNKQPVIDYIWGVN